ncbi:MAG: hypothetical protein FIA94_01615 [Nitrospirae bacterium]|nr:hypothetical protein [Nitrospirota bacterium]
MDNDIKSLILNIIGGVLVSLMTAAYLVVRHRFRYYHLQRLIGFQFKPETIVRMVYGQLLLPMRQDQSGQRITHPYVKAPRLEGTPPPSGTYSIAHPISECEVRASTYIASLLGLSGKLQPLLVSDTNASSILDSNFISFGGPGSNYKTADILGSDANILIRMAFTEFSLPSGERLPFNCSRDADYGFILRITSPEFPERAWIVCAGLGEWGTSGTAWFLANKWQTLIKNIHPLAYWSGVMKIPDFVAIIRVVPGQDQSARMVALYRKEKNQIRSIMRA